jgi:hypothetical protein
MDGLPDVSTILDDLVKILTATGVILTAVSSIMNRRKLEKVDKKIDAAAVEVAGAKQEAVRAGAMASYKLAQAHADTVSKIDEVKQLTQEVNAEIVQKVHDAGVEAGKAIAANGHGKGDSK